MKSSNCPQQPEFYFTGKNGEKRKKERKKENNNNNNNFEENLPSSSWTHYVKFHQYKIKVPLCNPLCNC